MSRSHNKRSKNQKRSVQKRASPAAAAAPIVQATHAVHVVLSMVPEAALLRQTSTQAFDVTPACVVLSQPPVSVCDAQVLVSQPAESMDHSASIGVKMKRCVRTELYNRWSLYTHVPRYLKEPLLFESNVKQVATERRRAVCFFAEVEDTGESLDSENVAFSPDTCKKEDLNPQVLNQDAGKTTLISSGSDVREKVQAEKIVTPAGENHAPEIALESLQFTQYFAQAKTADTTSASLTANLKTNNAEILTTKCKPQMSQELPKLVVSPQESTKLENVTLPSATPSPESAVSLEGVSQEKSLTKTYICFSTNPEPQIAPTNKSNEPEKQTAAVSSPNSAQEKKSNDPLATNRKKIHHSIAALPCKTATTIAPTQQARETIKSYLPLTDSAVNLIAVDVNKSAPKPKPKKAAKNLSRGQKRASLAKAAKVRQT
ncbi:hypothetical protein BJ741DRAFT_714677 [Chytriomyces cf. hyalinus JEL632]|nr:hypothetical protein BJ741DRAFT_714677 [Chytriomyces cf. hyalinus JEL632]